ncbi:MAG TPA: EamA family transporter [Candidatus Acidoferrum sp.]|nr:EamA family transporter [Candidatus Acidoferrum sp.]
MAAASHLRLKTYTLISLLVVFGPFGDLLMGKGMRGIGVPTSISLVETAHYVSLVLASGLVWWGTLCMIGFFICYISVLSWADYSYVQPATALTYGVVALLGKYILGEKISLLHWMGILVVCVGVGFISYTSPATAERPFSPPPLGEGPLR